MFVSNMSEYSGYSERVYNGYQCTSQYVTMSDGCKLAIDIFRPTKDGVLHTEPLPVVWMATPYRRRSKKPDGTYTTLEEGMMAPVAKLIEYGYVLATMDFRGSGASYGNHGMQPTLREFSDLRDMNEWLASQPWCTGKTGMYGLSAMGKAQLMCAMMNPPSLKCIVPNVAVMENPAMMTNGVVNLGWLAHIDEQLYEQNVLDPAPPVDEDTDGSMLQEAIEIHKSNPSVLKEREIAYCHDDYLPFWNSRLYVEAYYPNFLHAIDDGSIACYIIGGWKDFYAHDSLSWYCSLNKAPKRIAMGPWLHHESEQSISPYNYFTEHLRWYDYWLKDIDNGIMDEPPVLFYQNGAEEWRYLPDFPLPETKRVDYYLRDRASGTVNSINDGSMTKQRPDEKNRKIEYVVDYSMTKKGYVDRFYYTAPGSTDYTAFDEKSLTFTTVPFAEDVEMVGFPVVTLWFSANAKDVDFYFNLQEIDESGASRNISEQRLRASFRKTATPAFNNLGLPYHRLCRQDQEDLPIGQPVKGEVTLLPISNTIQKGHRLRLTINNYDDNWNTPVLDPAPVVTIYHSAEYPSGVSFPIITKSL